MRKLRTTTWLQYVLDQLNSIDATNLSGVDTITLGRAEDTLTTMIELRKARKRQEKPCAVCSRGS